MAWWSWSWPAAALAEWADDAIGTIRPGPWEPPDGMWSGGGGARPVALLAAAAPLPPALSPDARGGCAPVCPAEARRGSAARPVESVPPMPMPPLAAAAAAAAVAALPPTTTGV